MTALLLLTGSEGLVEVVAVVGLALIFFVS
jgi:hypothetical protein